MIPIQIVLISAVVFIAFYMYLRLRVVWPFFLSCFPIKRQKSHNGWA
jgi:hypothetical protein